MAKADSGNLKLAKKDFEIAILISRA